MRNVVTKVLATVLVASASASAAVVSYPLGFVFDGTVPPAAPAPWATLSFNDGGGTGSVLLTVTTAGLSAGEFISSLSLNLDPTLNPASLTFTPGAAAGFTLPSVSAAANGHSADGGGLFDVEFNFASGPPAARFSGGDTYTVTIAGIPTLTASSFGFVSSLPAPSGQQLVAAHVQSIAVPGGTASAWITVPEPTSLLALAGLGAMALRRRR